MLHRTTIIGIGMALATLTAGAASARSRGFQQLAMMEGIAVDPPRGYITMCREDLPLCSALGASGADRIQDENARVRLLHQINRFVNQHVRQESDEQTVGEPDVWRRPGVDRSAAGDCEDLAIEKRLELIAAGFPAKDLYFAIGLARGYGMHAVLVARTGQGDLVLDSLSPQVRLWSETPYIWVSRQAPGEPDRWESAMPLLPGADQLQLTSAEPYPSAAPRTDDAPIELAALSDTPPHDIPALAAPAMFTALALAAPQADAPTSIGTPSPFVAFDRADWNADVLRPKSVPVIRWAPPVSPAVFDLSKWPTTPINRMPGFTVTAMQGASAAITPFS
jgi:predicted transglutaminase-like cysteine proteinase